MRPNLLPTLVLAACIAALAVWTVALELEVRSVQSELIDLQTQPAPATVEVERQTQADVVDPNV